MLEQTDYCPVLYTRVAETKGYLQLPAAAKDTMFPIFRWRPWPNAKKLDKTSERITAAVGSRRFGIALDGFKKGGSGSADEAAAEFGELFTATDGHRKFYDLVSSVDLAVPVLQAATSGDAELEAELANVLRLDRGAFWLVEYPTSPNEERCQKILNNLPDIAIVLDAGWGRDILAHQLWASTLVKRLTAIRPELEIVVCGSSFPKDFSKIVGKGSISVEERSLFATIYQGNNAAKLTYGDWGSTRPPELPTPMGVIPRRIDVPFVQHWESFRQKGAETYEQIASRALLDEPQLADLKIWGTFAIESTALGVAGSIGSPAAAAAARINIHLYRQAQSGAAVDISEGDEPYTD